MHNIYKNENYLTIKEYAEIKGITKQAVFYMVKGGKLADVKEIELPGKNRKMYLRCSCCEARIKPSGIAADNCITDSKGT